MSAPQQSTEEALSAAVLGLEGSRRVGWAKAFEAKRQLENASHDLNVVREDRHIFRQRLSYTFGYLNSVLDSFGNPHGARLRTDLLNVIRLDDAPLDSVEVKKGMDHAKRVTADNVVRAALSLEYKAKVERERKRKRKESDPAYDEQERLFAGAKRKAITELAAEYGFRDEDELRLALKALAAEAGR